MKTKKLFVFLLIIISMSWNSKSFASHVDVWLDNSSINDSISFCNVDSIIMYKPSSVTGSFYWNPPVGGNIINIDSVIVTNVNAGEWFFNSTSIDKYIYVYILSSPPTEPLCMATDTSFCITTFSLTLDAENANLGTNITQYLWSTGETTQWIDVTDTGTYFVTITNACGVGVYNKIITQSNPNAPNLGADQTFCSGSSTVLDPGSTNVTTYEWSTGETTSTITVDTTGAYWINLLDNNGCSGTDTIQITALVPTSEEVCYVEFDTLTWKNNINWTTNLPGNTDSVRIYKETSLNVWTLIGTVHKSVDHFLDVASMPQSQSYSYKIAIVDTCGNESELSSFHTTITLLSAYDVGTNTYGFNWSAYGGLIVSDYYLYGLTSAGTATLIGTVPGNLYMYNYVNPLPMYVKYFVAFETPDCNAKSNVLVKSNWVQSVVTGLNQIETSQIAIYPNPATDHLEIASSENLFEIELINIFGQVLIKEKNKTTVDIQALHAGTYFVIVRINDNEYRQKIIVY